MNRTYNELKGKIAQWQIQIELAKLGIDSTTDDVTHDLHLWQRKHTVEVKSSKPQGKKNCKTKTYCFRFEKTQCAKDAFDYAVCIGYNQDESIDVIYIIPQKYLHLTRTRKTKSGELMIQILTEPSKKFMVCSSYDKFKPCRDLGLDVFLNDNKSSFTRKKNYIVNKLLKFDNASKKGFKHTFVSHFNNGGTVKEAIKLFKMNHTAVVDWRVKFGLTRRRKNDTKMERLLHR
tara:strand:- start:489 stop:1184 length:696 start_codon:yes stop_codon:yes gene_type:complete